MVSFVNTRSGWGVDTTPHKNVINLLKTGAVDKNREGESMCVENGLGSATAGKIGSGTR
jgi:hypothetical protein